MNYLLIGFLFALAAIGYQYQQNQLLESRLTTNKNSYTELKAKYTTSEENNRKLQEAEQARVTAKKALIEKQNDLQINAETRQETIVRSHHEVIEIKDWADQPLPAHVASLYDRPTFRSSADYLEYLRNANRLPPGGNPPED
jgi:LysB family phage lysis regulatory protein